MELSVRRPPLFTLALVFAFGLVGLWAHADDQDFNVHFQTTLVTQDHGPFTSPYQGQNSLQPIHESDTSVTWTGFLGRRLWHNAEFYVNPELAGGSGFSHTEGIAGFPNGEIYRVDDANPKWNVARLFFKQTFGLGGDREEVKDDKNQLASTTDSRRLTVVVGKFALNDYLDNNTYSHDPRTQFLNWTFMDGGAWDYAADTRGYSWGLYLEYNQPRWAVRWASVMVPLKANQMEMDSDFPAHRGDNLEFEYRYRCNGHKGVARWLAYENTANMGSYRQAINSPTPPDIVLTRDRRTKYGLGFNDEQEITSQIGAFGRLTWNDGHTETWNFTEVDRSFSLGLNTKGGLWQREGDSIGLGWVVNLLSAEHRDYLAKGGYGFLLGDGKLNYAAEHIAEAFYLYRLSNGLEATGDYQLVVNPGYNADRGPVSIIALRVHYEL